MNGNDKITYHQQVSYCGKPRCRKCREGKGHGPYWYAYQTINGHTTRTYIGKNLPSSVQLPEEVTPGKHIDPITSANLRELSADKNSIVARIFVLGQFRLERRQQRQWQSVTDMVWQQKQVRMLLGYLLCHPERRVSYTQALETLWPDSDLEAATEGLNRVIDALRLVLEPPRNRGSSVTSPASGAAQTSLRVHRPSQSSNQLLYREGEWLILADQSRVWVDADAFKALFVRIQQIDEEVRQVLPENAETEHGLLQKRERLLREATTLYGGDFLPEERRAKWTHAQRQSLRQSWVELLLEQADRHISQGAIPNALETLDRLLTTEPANEAIVQRFIYVLAQLKRRGEALRAYHRLSDLLQQEYNSQPSEETRALYEAVRQGNEILSLVSWTATRSPTVPASSDVQGRKPGAASQEKPLTRTTTRIPFTRTEATPVQIGRLHQSPLVGREMEQEVLRTMLLEVEQGMQLQLANQRRISGIPLDTQRHSQCVVLLGEAGIGKTRLAEEASREASHRGWSVIWSRVYPQERGIPYHIWAEVLRRCIIGNSAHTALRTAYATSPSTSTYVNATQETIQQIWQQAEQEQGRQRQAGQSRKRRETEAELRLPSQLQPLTTLLPELKTLFSSVIPPSPTPEQEQLRLWEAIRDLLISASESAPLLIVLDDVQWTDGSSGDLLGYLARHVYSHPILLLATCRDTELSTQPPHPLRTLIAHMQREHSVRTLQLNPLTVEEIRQLVAHLPETMVQHIQEQAAGNPFFAEELARSTPPTLPKTVAAALQHRMSRLSQPCQQLLGNAAVLGGSFEFPLIAAMEADNDLQAEDTILDLLEEALQSGVLTEEGTGTRVTYHFWHPLLVSHLYDTVSAVRRSRLHQRAAHVLQRIHARREEEVAATITHHLLKGGAEPSEIANYAEIAGYRAYTFSAYAEAEYHYRLTLEHLGFPISETAYVTNATGHKEISLTGAERHQLTLLELLAECMMIRGKFVEARHLYEYIVELHQSQDTDSAHEAQKQALLWGEIAWTWRYTGDNTHARECCQHGEQVLRAANIVAGPAWARLRLQQGSLHWQEGRYAEARQAAQESLALFTQQQKPVPSFSHPARSARNVLYTTRIQRTLEGDPVDLGAAHRLLGALDEAEGLLSDALNHLNTALVIFEQADHKRRIAHVSQDISYVHIKKAQYEPAHAALRLAYSLAERIGDEPLIGVITSNRAELAAIHGDLEEAEHLYRESLVFAERIHDREYISWWNARLANILKEQGELDEAAICIKRSLSTARTIHNNPRIGTALLALGNLRIAQAQNNGRFPKVSKRLLSHAQQDIHRALALPGLEAETKIKCDLALAHISLLLGEPDAQRRIAQVKEEAQRSELALVEAQAKMLLR